MKAAQKPIEKLDIHTKPSVNYCISLPLRDLQIRNNIKRIKERVQPGEINEHEIAVVGFGASLKKTWKEIRKFKHVITCSGSHKFLLDKGFDPGDFDNVYHVDVDPRFHKAKLLGKPHRAIQYLMASCMHKDVIDILLDAEANVKLWHIFAQDGESAQVIPHGEWSITGGSDAGMRAMTIARFLGYRKFHIFGMDGNIAETSHAAEHPNAPPSNYETECNGKTFKTTPALLSSAQQVFHELNVLKDVEFKFYGTGLIQEMAKTFVRTELPFTSDIAYVKETLISDEMRMLNAQLHESNVMYGCGGSKHAEVVMKMVTPDIKSVLDYGAGKQFLAKSLPFPIWSYDPAVPEISEPPRPADLVVATDMLEHVEPDKLKAVLIDLQRVVQKIGYLVIGTRPAKKKYANGQNAHLIIQNAEWWVKQLAKYFVVAEAINVDNQELKVIVAKKMPPPEDPITMVGDKARFYTPNETTKWRADTLLKKEPITIQWIEGMKKDEVLYDIGANVGGYSVWAGLKGVKVFSFEPEAENYALLVRNLALNNLDARAYCLALASAEKVDVLHMSRRDAGGSCHTFGTAVGPFGEVRNGNHPIQGCIGMALDDLLAKGLPQPDHIKIDVDGLESQVIKGGHKALNKVKTVLIEVNPKLPSHLEMVDTMKVLGFTYDDEQVESARRKSGPFEGVGEIVFYRETSDSPFAVSRQAQKIADHMVKQIKAAPYFDTPFRHCVVTDVLPKEIYKRVLNEMPPIEEFRPIGDVRGTKGYPERYVGPIPKKGGLWDMLCEAFMLAEEVLSKKLDVDFSLRDMGEMLLIRDLANYQIGPHTDSPSRLWSAILYLAPDDKHPTLGTSLYVPKKKGWTCKGGPHHPVNKFHTVLTVPYLPNTMFAFKKTNSSFHGVAKTDAERQVLLYDLRTKGEKK